GLAAVGAVDHRIGIGGAVAQGKLLVQPIVIDHITLLDFPRGVLHPDIFPTHEPARLALPGSARPQRCPVGGPARLGGAADRPARRAAAAGAPPPGHGAVPPPPGPSSRSGTEPRCSA